MCVCVFVCVYIYIYIHIHIHIRVQHSCSGSPTKRLGCNNSAHATAREFGSWFREFSCVSGQRVIAGGDAIAPVFADIIFRILKDLGVVVS